MATHVLGKIGMNPRGAYSATVEYQHLDVVTYNGSSYVALDECVGVAPTDASRWMMLAQGTGTTELALSFDSGSKFITAGLAPMLRVSGNVVEIHGDIKSTASITGSTTYYPICTVPYQYAPHNDVCTLQQGTKQQIWMLRIFGRGSQTPGAAMFARCRSGSSWSNIGTTTWLPFHATWVV